MNIGDLTITSLETITMFDIHTGDHRCTLDELQTATIANTQDKVDITGKGGRKLNSLKRNKAVVVSGANGLVSSGLIGIQTGSEVKTDVAAPIMWADYLTITNNSATLTYAPVGTEGNEVEKLYVKTKYNTLGEKLIQNATAGAGQFAYNPDTKALTFASDAYEDGTEIVVYYIRMIKAAAVVDNMSDVYSEKVIMYVDAMAEDSCNNIYRVQFYIPKADFSGNFDIALGDNQTVHAFEAESLAGACGAAGKFWTYTVFGIDAADVVA